jgi:DivIVA domain-containing protein
VDDAEHTEPRRSNDEPPAGEPSEVLELVELRDHVPSELRDVSFPGAVRGYDRAAVDAYVKRVNTVIAELEVSRSPQAAVTHALDRVGRQTSGILQRARETADEMSSAAWAEADRTTARANEKAEEITSRANAEAEETVARAKSEAEELVTRARAEAAERLERLEQELATLQEQANTRLQKVETDTGEVWRERTEILAGLRELAERLEAVASEATARLPERERSEPLEDRMHNGDADDD